MYVRVLDASSNDEIAEMVFKVLADEFSDDDTPTTFLSNFNVLKLLMQSFRSFGRH